MCKKYKNLIILRPVHSGPDNLRLGLYTDAFREFVSDKVTSLFVDFGDGEKEVPHLDSYVKYGSIVGIEQINGWLQSKGFLSPDQQLLFELEESSDGHRHTYRYIGSIIK